MGLQRDWEASLWAEEADRLKSNDGQLHLPSLPDQHGMSCQGNHERGDEGRYPSKETADLGQRGNDPGLGEKIRGKIQQEKRRTEERIRGSVQSSNRGTKKLKTNRAK